LNAGSPARERFTAMVDALGRETRFDYDNAGRMTIGDVARWP
jgi:hypothetical protein